MSEEKGVLMWVIQRPDGSFLKYSLHPTEQDVKANWPMHWYAQGYRAVRVRVIVEERDE